MKYRKALKILKKRKGLVFDSDDVYHVSERLELCDIFLPVTIKNRIEILLWIVSLTKEEDYKLPSRKYKKVYIHRTRYKYKNKKQKNFFMSKRWKNLRQVVINNYGKRCMRCGVLGGPCHIDHIFPRSRYPNLEFDFDNLQVLCNNCNMKKSNKFYCDFRKISDEEKMIIIRKANCFSLNITKIHSMDG